MRNFIKAILPITLFVFLIGFTLPGCYTQFSRPHVDTDDGYYAVEEDESYDEYYDEEEGEYYYDEDEDTVIVNYNDYDIYNYNYPYWGGGYDIWYDYPPFMGYTYYPYDLWYYRSYSPYSWWSPYAGWGVSSWIVGGYYYDYMWNYYPPYYQNVYNFNYYSNRTKYSDKKQPFRRGARRLVDEKQRTNVPAGVVEARNQERIVKPDRSKIVMDRKDARKAETKKRIFQTGKKRSSAAKDQPRINKNKRPRIADDARPVKKVTKKRSSVRKPVDKRYVKPRSRSVRKAKPDAIRRSDPKKKSSRVISPRSSSRKPSPNYIKPRTSSRRSYSKPAVRRSVTPKHSSSISKRSSTSSRSSAARFRSSGSSSRHSVAPSSISRSSGSSSRSTPTPSRSSSSGKSSSSSGSKSSKAK